MIVTHDPPLRSAHCYKTLVCRGEKQLAHRAAPTTEGAREGGRKKKSKYQYEKDKKKPAANKKVVKTAAKPATKKPAVKKTIKKMYRLAATKKKRAPKKKVNPRAPIPKKKKLQSSLLSIPIYSSS